MLRFTEPFGDLGRILNTFDRTAQGGLMPMDVLEHDGKYLLRFDLPGVSPEHIDLTVEGNTLTVTAERPVEQTEGVTWLLRERPSGTHRREVRIGQRLDTSEVNASYDNGVLTVTIPLREEAKARKVRIASGEREVLTVGSSS
jgi:HSP20 family protein